MNKVSMFFLTRLHEDDANWVKNRLSQWIMKTL